MPQQMKEIKSKAGRRGNNEGSIFQRKDGRWVGEVTVGYKSNGKPIVKTVYGKSRSEVAQKVNAMTQEVFTKGYITDSAPAEQNFEILCREWFDLFVAGTKSSTAEERQRTILKNHVYPVFGMLDIRHVEIKRLQRFFKDKAVRDGLSSDYISKMKQLLNKFFIYAVKQKLITDNPIEDVILCTPEVDDDDDNIDSGMMNGIALREEIRGEVLARVLENPILKPILTTLTLTGLRPQELIPLKWSRVNLDSNVLFVKGALKRTTLFNENGDVIGRGTKIGKPKTPSSIRGIPLPDTAAEVLREWQLYCKENKISSEYVFPNTKTGKMWSYSGLRNALVRFIEENNWKGEGIKLYSFRHTFATIMLEEGVNHKLAAETMGHKRLSTFLDVYCHAVSDSARERATQSLDGAFARYTQKKHPTSSSTACRIAGENPQ
jgi:integrase